MDSTQARSWAFKSSVERDEYFPASSFRGVISFFLLLFKFKTNKKKREWNKKGDFHSFCFQKESPIEEVFTLF
jgi:hypothetical protein